MTLESEHIDDCLNWNQALAGDGKDMICVEFSFSYHLGDGSGVTKSSIKGMKRSTRLGETWICQTCHISKKHSKPNVDEKNTSKEEPKIHKKVAEIADMLKALVPLEEKVELASVREIILEIEKNLQWTLEIYGIVVAKARKMER